MKETVNAVNLSIRYRYDLAGNAVEVTDRIGNYTGYVYDNRNLLLNKKSQGNQRSHQLLV
ncbi:RHS repeat domain-containing protein [Paenibacillus piri]|uniref:RHS repeat protein n=1 Tax=Paenibacillus piri TaxID=2547395 RepID=A0A4R5KHE2_9BACL|nr:RHS repeat domain-containing protein [Paenibacillus piri]TDF94145.1 hypothetical protein E1757_24970 [Paenibacillus piri]